MTEIEQQAIAAQQGWLKAPLTPPAPPAATTTLPPYGAKVGETNHRPLWQVLEYSSGSVAGLSATTNYLSCPRNAELKGLGIRPKPTNAQLSGLGAYPLQAMHFGTLMHALRAERFTYGNEARDWLLEMWRPELHIDDYLKAKGIWKTYDVMFPLGSDPFRFLGVECEVRTWLTCWDGRRVLRSVRYDTVIQYPDGSVFSFECKTMAKGGMYALQPYLLQGMTHSGLWNSNPDLVRTYGPMHGSLFDMLIKTKTPDCDRVPEYFTKHQQKKALQFMRAPDEAVAFRRDPVTGHMPMMGHTCWGRWAPCQYVNLCWDESYGAYQYADGSDYDGRL